MKPALLREPTKDAHGKLCPAGSIVYGDQTVGWPGYRVSWAVSNNRARYLEPKEAAQCSGDQPQTPADAEPNTADLDAGIASQGRRFVRRRG